MTLPPSLPVPPVLPGVAADAADAPVSSRPGDPSFSETLSAAVEPRAVAADHAPEIDGPAVPDAPGALRSVGRPLVYRQGSDGAPEACPAEEASEAVAISDRSGTDFGSPVSWLGGGGALAVMPTPPIVIATVAETRPVSEAVGPDVGPVSPGAAHPAAALTASLLSFAGQVAVNDSAGIMGAVRDDRAMRVAASPGDVPPAGRAPSASGVGSAASLPSADSTTSGDRGSVEAVGLAPGVLPTTERGERLDSDLLPSRRLGPASGTDFAGAAPRGEDAAAAPLVTTGRRAPEAAPTTFPGDAASLADPAVDADQGLVVSLVAGSEPTRENVAERHARRSPGAASAESAVVADWNAAPVRHGHPAAGFSGKNETLVFGEQYLKESRADVGTEAANEGAVMRLESPAAPLTASLPLVPELRAGAEGMRARPGTEAGAPWVAVGRVVDAADVLWATDRAGVDVKLQFEGEGVWVRVDYRDGEVKATFRAESPELRDRLTAAWQQHVAGAVESRPYRMADPLFEVGVGDRSASFSAQADVQGDASRRGGNEQAAPEWPARLTPAATGVVAGTHGPAVAAPPSELRASSLRLNVFA